MTETGTLRLERFWPLGNRTDGIWLVADSIFQLRYQPLGHKQRGLRIPKGFPRGWQITVRQPSMPKHDMRRHAQMTAWKRDGERMEMELHTTRQEALRTLEAWLAAEGLA